MVVNGGRSGDLSQPMGPDETCPRCPGCRPRCWGARSNMRKIKFSLKERKFLEFYFSGFLMMDAARGAGYEASTPQSRCNRGRAILTKFSNNPKAFFRLGGPRERRIAQLLVDILESKSEHKQMLALKILSKCFY